MSGVQPEGAASAAPVTTAPPVELSVVIPAFNESTNVAKVVEETVATLDREFQRPYELVLVDDGSRDDTGAVADEQARRFGAKVRSLHHETNKGLGAALQTAYAQVKGEYVSFIPGDGQVGVSEVLKLFRVMDGNDLIVSTRDREAHAAKIRGVLTWGMTMLTRIILGFDPSGMIGIYVIRRSVLQGFKLRATSGILNLEIPMRCYNGGFKVKRGISVDTRARISGSSKVTNTRTIFKHFFDLLKIRMAG